MTNTHFNLSRNDLCQNRLDFLGSILDPCFKSHISSFSFMSYLASSKPQQHQLSQVRLGMNLSQSSCCRLLLNCINQAPLEFLDKPNVEHIDGSSTVPLKSLICTKFFSNIKPIKSTLNS
ncbi:MAG: hypothetical protein VX737_03850 [Pseudomonadota bacterium]|nr:hypothetical protein [Pseudomonadota bacterium]